MVRLRVSWPFSLSSAPTVGNPCRPLQPESVSCTASRKIRSFRPLAPRRERQARNTSSTVAQSSSVIRVSMVGSSQTDLPSVTDPRTWESTHCILSPIRPHGLERAGLYTPWLYLIILYQTEVYREAIGTVGMAGSPGQARVSEVLSG